MDGTHRAFIADYGQLVGVTVNAAQSLSKEVRIMAKFVFMINRGTEDPSRATRRL
jgi:hypothetical protein